MAGRVGTLALKVRIALAIGVTGAGAIFAVVAYLTLALERAAMAQWQSERSADAISLAHSLDRTIRELIGDLRLMASVPAMSSLPAVEQVGRSTNGIPPGVDTEKRRLLDTVMDEGPFSSLFVLQPSGENYLTHPYYAQERVQRLDHSTRPYFVEATQTRQPVLSDGFVGDDGIPSVVIDIPRLNEGGEIVLHLGGTIPQSRLGEMFATAVTDRFDFGMLVDRKGDAVATAGQLSSAGLRMDPLFAAVDRFIGNGNIPGQVSSETYRDPVLGEDAVATFITLRSGWTLVLARGRSTFQHQIKPEITQISAIVAAMLTVMGLLCFAIATRMAERWEAAQFELKAAHEALEERVRERTADLDRSKKELESKSQVMETILENVSHGISLFDADLLLVACNHYFAEILHLPPDLVRPGTPLEVYIRRNAERGEYGRCDVEALVAQRMTQARRFEYRKTQRVSTDGRVIEVVETPLPDGGYVTTHTDITDQTRSEEALKTLSRAVEQSPVSVVITDPNGNIEYVNPKFEEVTGYAAHEVVGRNPRLLKSGLTGDGTYTDLWRTISHGGTWEGEMQNRRKNGELFWERASISPIRSPDGQVIHFLAVKEDITARKKADEDVMAAWQAAKEANHAKTIFLSHMSHELRTPLTAVLGYAEMLTLQVDGPLSPTYADYVDNIVTSGQHLLLIIDEVLDISRIELESFRITESEFDLNTVVRECVNMMKPQCVAKGISIRMEGSQPIAFRSDARAIRQILINLIGNAVKYTNAGGIAVMIEACSDGLNAAVSVRDTGCGIPPEKLQTIFEPFQRVDPHRADPSRGVGLGLAICRRITTMLGGTILIQSVPDQGTTAIVTIPIQLGKGSADGGERPISA